MNNINVNNDYYGNISNTYSQLSNEVAILKRKIYLPLLPLEKMTDMVIGAYRYLGKDYWYKDDVYEAKSGCFRIPLICPLIKDSEEAIDVIHSAPQISGLVSEEELITKDYITCNYIPLIIPRDIIMQFSNLIPKKTQFNVTFMGGSSANYQIKVNSIAKTVSIPEGEWDDSLYDTKGMSFDAVVKLVKQNLEKIEKEEARRRKEEKKYEKPLTEEEYAELEKSTNSDDTTSTDDGGSSNESSNEGSDSSENN